MKTEKCKSCEEPLQLEVIASIVIVVNRAQMNLGASIAPEVAMQSSMGEREIMVLLGCKPYKL